MIRGVKGRRRWERCRLVAAREPAATTDDAEAVASSVPGWSKKMRSGDGLRRGAGRAGVRVRRRGCELGDHGAPREAGAEGHEDERVVRFDASRFQPFGQGRSIHSAVLTVTAFTPSMQAQFALHVLIYVVISRLFRE